MEDRQKAKKIALLLLEYLVGVGIVYWLYRSNILDFRPLQTITFSLAAVGLLMVLLMVYFSALRLKRLLRDQGIFVTVAQGFIFNCLGIFYSLFLPGGVSGDAAKAFYLMRYAGDRKAALFGGLILDRLLGMLAMIGLGLGSSAFLVYSVTWLMPYFIAFALIFLVMAGVLFFLLRVELRHKESASGNMLIKGYEYVHNLIVRLNLSKYSKRTLVISALLSIAGHCLAIGLIYLCSVHSQSGLDFMAVFSVGPFGLLANAIPITPGGLGVGEQSFEFLYKIAGGKNGASSFLASRLFLYSPAVIGGLVAAVLFLRLHKMEIFEKFLPKARQKS